MLYVGLTGRVASGKSTVAKIFRDKGITVVDADKIAKELTVKNTPIYNEIIEYFGKEILDADDEINRKKLRDIIFNDSEKRIWLEKLLHPAIRKQIDKQRKVATSTYCIIEIPLLTDKSLYPYLNRVLLVISNEKNKITRLVKRDKISKEAAGLILQTQQPEDVYREIADDIIVNNYDFNSLEQNVVDLHNKYMKIAAKNNL